MQLSPILDDSHQVRAFRALCHLLGVLVCYSTVSYSTVGPQPTVLYSRLRFGYPTTKRATIHVYVLASSPLSRCFDMPLKPSCILIAKVTLNRRYIVPPVLQKEAPTHDQETSDDDAGTLVLLLPCTCTVPQYETQ